MRKNRKMSRRMSVVTVQFMHVGAVMVTVFAMAILNLLASSSCTHLKDSIGAKMEQLKKLEDECQREAARWAEMQTTERLEAALVRHGLSMRTPKPAQVVRMRANGTPVPGQISIAKAESRARAAASATASVSPLSRSRVNPQIQKTRARR